MSELLIGCGRNREKKLAFPNRREWSGLVTLDMNPDHKPDILHDLSVLPLPVEDGSCDEIHAYDVLEHIGAQGDWRWFFAQWADFWRALKPGGMFFGISPHHASPWAWGDPGHTRIIGPECLTFLQQPEYDRQVGHTAMTDYRFVYRADFDLVHTDVMGESFMYGLRAVKPSRCACG